MDVVSFGTDGWRATLDEFTTDRVKMVGQAVATHLRESGAGGAVAVGYDARESSPRFAADLAEVLADNGHDVLLPRRDCPTPAIAWTVTDRDLAGAVMVTASHNPPEYNGVKFIPADGAPALPEVTASLEAHLDEPAGESNRGRGAIQETAVIDPYLRHGRSFVQADLAGLSVVYDAMHGSGRGVTDQLLESCGADVIRLRCDPDPAFGGTAPEPTAANLVSLVEKVSRGDVELGIANDGDADRLAVVTPSGYVDANLLFAVLYDHLLETQSGDVVRTVSTSGLIDRLAAAAGQSVHETAVGFKWVARAMETHDALLGGEESGGFGITDHLRNKDGVVLALVIAAAHVAEPIDERLDRIRADHGGLLQGRESIECPTDRKQGVIDALETTLPDRLAGVPVERVNTTDGFKIVLTDGSWVLIRPSGTEPKMRIYAESAAETSVPALLSAGRDLVMAHL